MWDLCRTQGRAYNSEHQYELIQECASRFAEEKTYRLLVNDISISGGCSALIYPAQIVDSIMALFRVDFSGRGELSERQQKVLVPLALCCVILTVPPASSSARCADAWPHRESISYIHPSDAY